MSWLGTLGGIMKCASTGLQILQSFKTESATYPVGSGHGKGFWNFVSYSVVSNLDCPLQNIENYVENRLLPRMTVHSTRLSEEQLNDMKVVIEDYFYVQGWLVGDTDIAISNNVFAQDEQKLYLYLYNFHRDTNRYGELVRVSSMYTRTEYRLAEDWTMMCTISQSMFKGKQATEIKYSTPSLTPEKLIDAYAIAFAPISLGLIRAPENFLKTISDAIARSAENPSELPGEMSDAAKAYSQQLYEAMAARQQTRDALAVQALQEAGGQGNATLNERTDKKEDTTEAKG